MSHARLYISNNLLSSGLPEDVHKKSADVEHFVFDSFGIKEARDLQSRAYILPVVGKTRDFLVNFKSITVEAQNALLKLFEEPPVTSIFHVVLENENILIPTLRSRLILVESTLGNIKVSEINLFLEMSYKDRIEEVTNRTKKKDLSWINDIAIGAEQFAESECKNGKYEVLKNVLFIRQYLGARGSSAKMLLEELALTLPVRNKHSV